MHKLCIKKRQNRFIPGSAFSFLYSFFHTVQLFAIFPSLAFKEQTGYTIGNYLSTKRLLLAKDLIAEGAPITEVCYACGFKNYSTFSRAYKKSFGEAPRESLQNLKS